MGAADCEAFVKGIVGEKLTDEELEKAFERYDELKKQFVLSGKTDNIEKRIAAVIAHEASMKKYAKAKARRTTIENVTIKRELNDYIKRMEASGYGPAQSIYFKMEGGQSNDLGVRDSVDSKKNAIGGRWIGGFLAESMDNNPGILKMARDRTFDENFATEYGEIREGGTPGSTGNKFAQDFARIVKKWMETARLEYNSKGGMKQADDGFTAMSHDPYRMKSASKEAWVNFVYDRLDIEKSLPGVDPSNMDEIKQILRRDYDMKVTGRYFGPDITHLVQKKTPSSLIDRFSIDGNLHFKDGKSQIEYQRQFGHGTFVSSVIYQMMQMSRATAMMDVFGPTPEIMIKQLAEEHVQRLGNLLTNITDMKEHAKITKQISDLQYEKLRGAIDEMTGTAAVPTRPTFAKVSAGIRSVLAMAKLSNLVTSSTLGDSMNMMANNIYGGQRGLDALAPVIRMFESMDPKERKMVAFRLGEGMQGFIGSVFADAIHQGPMDGTMAKTMNTYFKWIGVTGMFDHSRQAFVRERSVWLGKNRDKEFKDLDPFLQKGFIRNGIDELRWNAIRSADMEAINGEQYLMPEAARMADEKYILQIASPRIKEAFHLAKVDEAKMEITKKKRMDAFEKRRLEIIDETRYDLEMQLRQYYGDETNYAVIQPTAKSRRISRGAVFGSAGTRPGELIGEVVRSMFMFKSFSIVNWDNMARAIQDKNVLRMGAAGVGVLGRLIAFQVVAGFMIEYMKDIAKGNWPPRAPWDGELVARALSTGGSMGMYGDYLTSLFNGYNVPAGLLGPEIEQIAKTSQFLAFDLRTKKKGKTAEALSLALDVTPFGNLMVARPALDALIFDEIREWSSPGYKTRKRNKLQEKGQTNLFQEMFR